MQRRCAASAACCSRLIAVGDAALAFDPLSSQGIHTALYTGLAAASTADRLLAGDDTASLEYAAALKAIWRRYVRDLAAYYGLERPFLRQKDRFARIATRPA